MIEQTIRSCFALAAQAVSDRSEEINKLNVFPVPDGDTGTNMALTLGTVVKELEGFTVIKIKINDFAELANYGFLKPLKITGLPAYAVFPAQAPEPDCAHEPLGEGESK